MRLCRKQLWTVAVGLWLALGIAARAQEGQVITGFRVPEYDENGRLKWRVTGDSATILKDGNIAIMHARVEMYKEGALYLWTTAERCVYDRDKQIVTSDSAVEMETDSIHISGVGFRWTRADGVARVLSQVKVVLKNAKIWFLQERKTYAR
jgi:LPS export ABC transporter protein LptC